MCHFIGGINHFFIWKILDYIKLEIENKTVLNLHHSEKWEMKWTVIAPPPQKKDGLEIGL